MCENLAAELIDSNVYGCGLNITLNTPLEQFCDDLKDPLLQFNEFCLFPSTDNLDPICDEDAYVQDAFIFNQLQSGDITTLEDLPILWETPLALVGKTDEWVEVQTATIVEGLTMQRLPYYVISDNGIMLGTTTFPYTTALVSTFVMSDPITSLFYPIHLPSDAATVLGTNPLIAISNDGNIRAIGPYVWTTLNPVFTLIPEAQHLVQINGLKATVYNTISYLMYFGSTTASNSPVVLLTFSSANPITTPLTLSSNLINTSVVSNGQRGFLTLNPPLAMFSIAAAGGGLLTALVMRNFVTNANVSVLSLTSFQMSIIDDRNAFGPTTHYGFNTAASFGFTFPFTVGMHLWVTNQLLTNGNILHLEWSSAGAPVVNAAPVNTQDASALFLDASADGNIITYQSSIDPPILRKVTSGSVVTTITPQFANRTFDVYSRFTIFKQATDLYSIWTQDKFTTPINEGFIAVASNSAIWSNPFNFYTNVITMNDLGSATMDPALNPGQIWQFGRVKKIIPEDGKTNFAVSRHNRYRFVIQTVATTFTDTNFNGIPHIASSMLQRHNDVLILQNAAEIKLFQNGNIEALNGAKEIIWQTNMDDANGSNQNFILMSKTQPTVSINGNYLTFWPEDGTFRQCYYPFNSERLRDWCLTSDTRFNNSINQQQDFCFDNLQEAETDTNIKFFDLFCSCIGGERLFNNLFINVEDLPVAEKALLLDNLPCLMVDCSKARVNTPPTNVFRLLLNKCQVPIIICSITIRAEDRSNIGGIGVIQDCGSNDFPLPDCLENEDCPLGSICIENRCELSCSTSADCTRFGQDGFECVDGGCIAPPDNGVGGSGLSIGAIAGIAVAIIVVIVLVSVLLWYFLVKKKQV